ncbi:hypothetical protein E7681_18750 [Thalassobius vesicularis]|uniref:Uncharacterized protein n=1 Tax=Thalassobius vesicularis TaxID=1294297 RepID=A0A4S3M4C1_9RHOB|nr:hypothetical protein [Thalassobius vesicularis]THD70360.1 hypothetical protein E7681_18750 [Thalassobius vesicularis]
MLRIDPADYELALAQARADLAAFNAESAQLATEAANTTRILELERERLALAETDLERIRTLTAQGTQTLKPLVISVVFGLLAATVLILLVLPAFYAALEDIRPRKTANPIAG